MTLSRRTIFRSNSREMPNSSKGSPGGSGGRSSSIGTGGHSSQSQVESSHIRDQESPPSNGRSNSTSPASVGVVSQPDLVDALEEDELGVDLQEEEEFDEVGGDSPEEEEFDEGCNILPIVAGQSSDSSDCEMVDAQDRKRIQPRGKTFKNSGKVMKVATAIVHSHYDGSWISWKKVPDDVRQFWWKQFEKVYFWKDRHAQMVRTNWQRRISQHIRSAFKNGRHDKKKPKFVSKEDWDDMVDIWKTNLAYQKSSKTNKQNRASEGRFGKGSYAGGSKSSVEIAVEFKAREKRKMTQEELMKATFRKKKTKEWTGPGPLNIIKRYKKLYAEYSELHPEGVSEEAKNMLWCEAAGGDYRGRLCGQGSLHNPKRDFRNPAALVPSPSSHVENAIQNQVANSSSMQGMIEEQNSRIAALSNEMLQEKQRHQFETTQLHQSYMDQIQRLVGMQRPHDLQHSLAPQYASMQAPFGHRYVQQQPPTYTSLLLGSTTNGFASPLVGDRASEGPVVSTTTMTTPNMPYVSCSPSFDPSTFGTLGATNVGGSSSLYDHSNHFTQRPHASVGGLSNANGNGATASYGQT